MEINTGFPVWCIFAGRFKCDVYDFGLETFYIPYFGWVQTGIVGYLMVYLWLTGWMNAYNFMDGIDGIAASQAAVVAMGWSYFALKVGCPLDFSIQCFFANQHWRLSNRQLVARENFYGRLR
ncbi:MAG: hypothetical protein U5K31_02755 [Balneolaceae bacterium]|nr:hypothetical protein [Balneolaceae bacterium]